MPLRRSGRSAQGFTLLEIMLVVMIIAVLLGTAIFMTRGQLETGERVAVQGDLSAIKTQLLTYRGMNGFYPTTEQGLKALVVRPETEPRPRQWTRGFDEVPIDPWGKEYHYIQPGKINTDSYDLYSSGPDRIAGTDDDVGNWR